MWSSLQPFLNLNACHDYEGIRYESRIDELLRLEYKPDSSREPWLQ